MQRRGVVKTPALGGLILAAGLAQADGPFLEPFESLDAWEPLTFPKIPSHSRYSIADDGGGPYLRAESRASASGLVSRLSFDVYAHPHISWRWRVEGLYLNRNVLAKEGDDYPIRIYVLFEYDPAAASFGERLRYGAARLVYGAYPPHSTLNYVWSSADETPDLYPNPFTERARMIPLRRGAEGVGEWVTETVDVLEDYRRAFGRDPPTRARLAIMNDSDNTGESAVSGVDWIRVDR